MIRKCQLLFREPIWETRKPNGTLIYTCTFGVTFEGSGYMEAIIFDEDYTNLFSPNQCNELNFYYSKLKNKSYLTFYDCHLDQYNSRLPEVSVELTD